MKSDRLGISASDRSGNRRAGAGGTVGRHGQYLPLKTLSKNPLDILKGYLVKEEFLLLKKNLDIY